MFSPDEFLGSSIPDTVRILVPVGVYSAQVENVKAVQGTSKDGKPWARLDVIWNIDDAEVRDATRRSKVIVTQGVMLDLTENGEFDTERNERLNKVRKSLGLPAGSPTLAFMGRAARVSVIHEMYEGEARERVNAVASL